MSDHEPAQRHRALWSTLLVVAALVVAGLAANGARSDGSGGADDVTTGRGPTGDRSAGPAVVTGHDDGYLGTGESDDVSVRNAIVFLVDDMSDFACDQTPAYLPRSSRWLYEQGTCYTNATVATPVCCPARAQIQTGQLAHNNGVRSQIGARNLDGDQTVQHDLGEAGMSTYGVGKFLNGLASTDLYGPTRMTTGFEHADFWASYKMRAGQFDLFGRNGGRYRPTTGLSSTQTSARYLDRYLDRVLDGDEPFYAYSAFFAPHKQSTRKNDASLPVPSPENADKPVPPFSFWPERASDDKLPMFDYPPPAPRSYYEKLWAARIRSLYDVDEVMASVFERLETRGMLDETAVIFTSDNGYSDRGQFNWDGKSAPYPAATNIPMLAWYPGRDRALDTRPVSLIDVAPTLYDLLDVEPGHLVDGHSLLGDHEREVVYGEFFHESNAIVGAESGRAARSLPSWRLVTRGVEAYVEWYWPDGSVRQSEYYLDPGMTENLLYRGPGYRDGPVADPERVAEMRDLMARYAVCAGTEEQGSPRPCT
ncbi:hypothetical protein GCM10023340_20720 [Nocardioides marinquilinus]|uniref:Sulfatase N-terminal domain-containing protein n=1 Tax=Nocardioides marinquilinus TaxID=1210400 RepID=A0ABP9PNJ1_9ACTN